MNRTAKWILALLLICATTCVSFAESELSGSWMTTGFSCYGVSGANIILLTLAWQDGFYQASLSVLDLAGGNLRYQTSGIAYAIQDVLVCLFQEVESVRMDVLFFELESDTLVWQWSTVGSDGEYIEDVLTLYKPYERTNTSEDS